MIDESSPQQIENALQRLASVVEQLTDPVVITDKDGIIEYVNPAFEELTGYSEQEAIGKTPSIVKSGEHDKKFYEELWEVILSGNVYRGAVVNRKKNGELYSEEKTITPLRDEQGNITHFVSTGKDITERKAAEAERERLLADLEQRTTQLQTAAIENARLFEQMQARAERERLVRAITERIRRGTDTQAIMQITLQELGQMLGASLSILRLGTREQLLSSQTTHPPGVPGEGKGRT